MGIRGRERGRRTHAVGVSGDLGWTEICHAGVNAKALGLDGEVREGEEPEEGAGPQNSAEGSVWDLATFLDAQSTPVAVKMQCEWASKENWEVAPGAPREMFWKDSTRANQRIETKF